jgi:hypothetical protein
MSPSCSWNQPSLRRKVERIIVSNSSNCKPVNSYQKTMIINTKAICIADRHTLKRIRRGLKEDSFMGRFWKTVGFHLIGRLNRWFGRCTVLPNVTLGGGIKSPGFVLQSFILRKEQGSKATLRAIVAGKKPITRWLKSWWLTLGSFSLPCVFRHRSGLFL